MQISRIRLSNKTSRLRPQHDALKARQTNEIQRLGSTGSGELNPESSDLDFLIMFEDLEPAAYADHYLCFYEDLTLLFNRRIELVSSTAITNPYFLESIQRNRETLYAV